MLVLNWVNESQDFKLGSKEFHKHGLNGNEMQTLRSCLQDSYVAKLNIPIKTIYGCTLLVIVLMKSWYSQYTCNWFAKKNMLGDQLLQETSGKPNKPTTLLKKTI